MNHYPHHIGDFDRATRHLTRIERSVYRDLIELYYDTEQPLVLDKAALCRKIIARSNEESTAVEQVLNEFFTETPTGWYHSRCEAEIEAYRSNTSQKAVAGRASAEAKRLKKLQALNGESTPVQQPLKSVATESNGTPTNQEPRTNNHKKSAGRASAPPSPVDKPEDVTDQTWADWLQLRKAKKAPVTATVVNGARREAEKANMPLENFLATWCARGSQGLQADWLKPAEIRGSFGAQGAETSDPDSRSAIEAEGIANGIGPWDELREQWPRYKARVRGQQGFAKNIVAMVAGGVR